MPNITINVPPAVVPDLVAAMRLSYTDLPDTEAAALTAGIQRIMRDTTRDLLHSRTLHVAQQQAQASQDAAETHAGTITAV